jgi:hypothetical protein
MAAGGLAAVPALKSLEGPALGVLQLPQQQSLAEAQAAYSRWANTPGAGAGVGAVRDSSENETRRTIVVAFLGGVSYLEVAALRFVSEKGGWTLLRAADFPLHNVHLQSPWISSLCQTVL